VLDACPRRSATILLNVGCAPATLRDMRLRVAAIAMWLASTSLACGDGASLRVEFFGDEIHEFSWWEMYEIRRIALDAVGEARRYLPGLSPELYLRVHPARTRDVIAATGESGSAATPSTVVWQVDPTRPGGVTAVAKSALRACLFHELHHLVRDAIVTRATVLDASVTEGMASVFERDYAQATVPWAAYRTEEAKQWVEELRQLSLDAEHRSWLFRHPDGRRWIAFKAGAYLVDRAMHVSGKSAAELVTLPTHEILRLAGH